MNKQIGSITPIIMIIMLCFLVLTTCDNDKSSNDEDDNSNSDNDNNNHGYYGESPPAEYPECVENNGPQLLGITLLVNGEETEMPATIQTTDTLAIAMEYSDEDCNLLGGYIQIFPNQHEPSYSEIADYIHNYYDLDQIGCSSDEEGEPYTLNLDPNDFLLPEELIRTFPLQFFLNDRCHYKGDPDYLPLDFTVVEE